MEKHLYFVHPHMGGTYTVYQSLKSALRSFEIELQAFNEAPLIENPKADEKELAIKCINEIKSLNPSAIYINILSSSFLTNLCRYIPSTIPVIAIVHSITPGTYGPVIAYQEHLSHVVAVSLRIESDLTRLAPSLRGKISTIPTGLHDMWINGSSTDIKSLPAPRSFLFAGRIENSSKGVSKLAKAFALKYPEELKLTVAGEGVDLLSLKEALYSSPTSVHFLGPLAPSQLQKEMKKHRFFVSPSNYEGQLIANLEAMSCGCVPITSKIRGVTDTYIQSFSNGVLIDPRGSRPLIKAIHKAIAMTDDEWLKLARQSIADAFQKHNIKLMSDNYSRMLNQAFASPRRRSLDIESHGWIYPKNISMRAALRQIIPPPLKLWLRQQLSVR